MLVLAPFVRTALDIPTGLTAFTGMLVLAWMALPTIVSVVEDVLDSVPKTYRDGQDWRWVDPLADDLANCDPCRAHGDPHCAHVGDRARPLARR
jgi:hypothetical protein